MPPSRQRTTAGFGMSSDPDESFRRLVGAFARGLLESGERGAYSG